MNQDRSINPGFRFPFERLIRSGWRVAAPGGRRRDEVGLTILGRPSGRAGVLDPTHIRWKRLAVGGWDCSRNVGTGARGQGKRQGLTELSAETWTIREKRKKRERHLLT